jgi:hypothetical protein
VLTRIVAGQTRITNIDSLLPWNWKAARLSTNQPAQAAA